MHLGPPVANIFHVLKIFSLPAKITTHRYKKGYRAYCAYKGLMTSKLLNKCTKMKTCLIL